LKNNNRLLTTIIGAVVLIAVGYMRMSRYDHSPTTRHDNATHTTTTTTQPSQPSGNQGEIEPDATLTYTHHARCRMDCRHITEADIRELLLEGHINAAKSKPSDSPCPTFAIEDDRNSDGARLRIVFARCDHETKVVTCIDRDHDYECHCQ
jgi:Domain of unknown function (DUF4258)